MLGPFHEGGNDPIEKQRVGKRLATAALDLPGARERNKGLKRCFELLFVGATAPIFARLDAVGAVVIARACNLPLDRRLSATRFQLSPPPVEKRYAEAEATHPIDQLLVARLARQRRFGTAHST